MNEDEEMAVFLRKRLEEGVSPEPPRMEAIMRVAEGEAFRSAERRSRLRLFGAALAAASLALVCSFAVVGLHAGGPSQKSAVAGVINLLRAADGVETAEGDAVSPAEMLLAWQDAPYEDAIAGLVN